MEDRWKAANNDHHGDQLKAAKLWMCVSVCVRLKDRGYILKLELWVMSLDRQLSSKQLVTRLIYKSTDVVVLLGCWNKSPHLYTEPLDELHSKRELWSHLGAIDLSGLLTLGLLSFLLWSYVRARSPTAPPNVIPECTHAPCVSVCVCLREAVWCLTGELHYRHSSSRTPLSL